MLNAVARMNTKVDEFPVVGFHGYMAKGIPFIQVRNVQFQSAIHMWEALKASSEQNIQDIVMSLQNAGVWRIERSAALNTSKHWLRGHLG